MKHFPPWQPNPCRRGAEQRWDSEIQREKSITHAVGAVVPFMRAGRPCLNHHDDQFHGSKVDFGRKGRVKRRFASPSLHLPDQIWAGGVQQLTECLF